MKKTLILRALFAAALLNVACSDNGAGNGAFDPRVDAFVSGFNQKSPDDSSGAPVTPGVAKYAVTISNGGAGFIGNGYYAADSLVVIYAGAAPSGQRFKNWAAQPNVAFADANNALTTFTMPARAVTATATFERLPDGTDTSSAAKYAVTVSSAGTGAIGGGGYAAGAQVVIYAGTAPAGQQFKNWASSSGGAVFANANSEITTFVMPANPVTVTANFAPVAVTPPVSGTFTDSRDGATYSYVTINGKSWMVKNLNYNPASGSWCYANDSSNCIRYGRLYDWNVATTVCPAGWHLPSVQEWDDLVTYAGGPNVAGKRLKTASGWGQNGDYGGTNAYGFSALPGGFRVGGSFTNAGDVGYWWTSTAKDSGKAYGMNIDDLDDGVAKFEFNKSGAFSVRCVGGGGTVGPQPATYTVTFSANGGSGTAPAPQSVTAGASITMPSGSNLSKSGYTFSGWNTNNSGTGTNYNAGSAYAPSANVTLYAKWNEAAATPTYTVIFSANGGSGTTPASQSVTAGTAITLPSGNNLSKSGYAFSGWNTNSAGTGTNYNAGNAYTPSATAILYAKWTVAATSLVCDLGEAWVNCEAYLDDNDEPYYSLCEGLIFKQTGRFFSAYKDGDYGWYYYDYGDPDVINTWATTGNTLTITTYYEGYDDEYTSAVTYSISGNLLTVTDSDGESWTYTKTSGVYPEDGYMYKSRAGNKTPLRFLLKR